MQNEQTLSEVIGIIGKYAERREAIAGADASTRISELGVSSLNFVEIVVKIEETFNVSISDEEFQRIATIGDAVNVIATAKAVAV